MEWLPQKISGGRNIWVVTFDGGVDSRIGQGGSAFVVWHYNTSTPVEYGFQYSSDYASNNIEEYRGMIAGMRAAKRWCTAGHDMVAVMGDSQLVVDRYFAIFAKAIRFLQNTSGFWLGHDWTNYWSFVWVDDDIALIEPDIKDRLNRAEWDIRQSVETVMGPKGWKHEKFETWTTRWKSLGLIWNSQACTVEMPEAKLAKAATLLEKISGMDKVTVKELQSLLGKLRHLIICAPVSKPFVQRIQHLVNIARKEGREVVSDMGPCQADLKFWATNLRKIDFTAWPQCGR